MAADFCVNNLDILLYLVGLLARMPREDDLTIQDTLAKLKELEYDSNEPLNIVLALPEVAVISNEEDLDENDMTKGGADFPDAPGEI